jgi:hypothetical protein
MIDLKCYRKTNVYFYGNEAEKRAFYIACVCPFFAEHKKGRYFAIREWNGGPNVEVVYYGEKINKKALRDAIVEYCKINNLVWSADQIEANLYSYKKNQANLLKMENKNKVEILDRNHLSVCDGQIDIQYYKRTYNSSDHVKLHFESRFLLQPLLEEALVKIHNKQDMNLLVMKLYCMTMRLFEHGEKFASLMYVSNITGVFALAKQYGKEDAFRSYFESEYEKYPMEKFDQVDLDGLLLERFSVAWTQIYNDCIALVDEDLLSEEGYYRLEDQVQQARANMQGLESEFHQMLVRDEHLIEMVSGKIHLVFRSIANILYNVLPSLNLSFLDKHFCCYAVVRYIMEKYDTDWKQIMNERVI